jgi:hypothetical protein
VNRSFTIIGFLAGLLLPCSGAIAEQGDKLLPVIPPAIGEQCVAPTEVMRRDHMQFLMHQRDDTVHSGIRGAKYSLVGCIGCHTQRNSDGVAIPVNAKGQFCESCHAFAGVRMDCFECHASVPDNGQAHNALAHWIFSPAVRLANAACPGVD